MAGRALGSFINPYTGERLSHKAQVCPACQLNFANTKSGDKHRIGGFNGSRRCADPLEVGLVAEMNKFGSTVWRWIELC